MSTEYQGHTTWLLDMEEYIKELPSLSVEMEWLQEHNKELQVSDFISIKQYSNWKYCKEV